MKELLTYVAQNLVDHPDQVSVTQHESDGETVLELRVAPEDMGKVIGRDPLRGPAHRSACLRRDRRLDSYGAGRSCAIVLPRRKGESP